MKNPGGAALRTFMRIADRWQMTDEERFRTLGLERMAQLQVAPDDTEELPHDVLERISCVLGIFKAINTLLPLSERADGWIRAANSASVFAGETPLELITAGELSALRAVRQYLDGQLV